MDILELMKKRHSVRSYTARAIEDEKRNELNSLISEINNEAGLNIQIFYDEPKCFSSIMAHYGKFSGVKNYIALVGKKSKDLDEKIGYYGEKIVLKAQEMGLNTCWVAMTHGKTKAKINKGEKQVCLITIGYGVVQGETHKIKLASDVSNCADVENENFTRGVEAALLAPTAMNQQKFYFTLNDDKTVSLKSGMGFYSKVDMGIVKYHFEAISGINVR